MGSYWLLKSEPGTYSIDDFERDGVTAWDCVRNYQARNYLCEMKVGDQVLFYHSSTEPSGVAGLGKVAKPAYADPTQFDRHSDYYDAKATKDEPRWFSPDIRFVQRFEKITAIGLLRKEKGLQSMVLLQRGSRLSVQPVSKVEYETILKLTR